MTKKIRLKETEEGTTLFNVDPIIFKNHYEIDYIHSFAQDTPFFKGLSEGKLLGSECKTCGYKYATPRACCMYCGKKNEWFDLPLNGTIHSWTTCFFGGQAFLEETPYHLILVQFEGVDTLFLSRLVGMGDKNLEIGMKVNAQFIRNSKFRVTDVYFVVG